MRVIILAVGLLTTCMLIAALHGQDEQMTPAQGIKRGPVGKIPEYVRKLMSERDSVIKEMVNIIADKQASELVAVDSMLDATDRSKAYKNLSAEAHAYRERVIAACEVLGTYRATEAVAALVALAPLGRKQLDFFGGIGDRNTTYTNDFPAVGTLIKIGQPVLKQISTNLKGALGERELFFHLLLVKEIAGSVAKAEEVIQELMSDATDERTKQRLKEAIDKLKRF